jgi:guanylate kinase
MKIDLEKGAILILSGPSGCGKSSLLKKLYEKIDNYYFSISTTTREPRVGEKDGVDYFFVTKEEFEKDIKEDNFLEYAKVHNNYYGTSLKPVYKALDEAKLVIFDIDVQGHTLVKNRIGDIVTSVFITTPDLNELERRLRNRATDDDKIIQHRLENARIEIEHLCEYDYFILNDDLEKSAQELISIALSSKRKTKLFDKKSIVDKWLK